MTEYLGMNCKYSRSIRAAQRVIERSHEGQMDKSEEDTFKVAFTVFVMSTLLAPGAKYDYAGVDYWNAFENPHAIGQYDWAEYVVHGLRDAVVKVKSDVKNANKAPIITGCSLFLQVKKIQSLSCNLHAKRMTDVFHGLLHNY